MFTISISRHLHFEDGSDDWFFEPVITHRFGGDAVFTMTEFSEREGEWELDRLFKAYPEAAVLRRSDAFEAKHRTFSIVRFVLRTDDDCMIVWDAPGMYVLAAESERARGLMSELVSDFFKPKRHRNKAVFNVICQQYGETASTSVPVSRHSNANNPPESEYLTRGELTLITGPSNAARSRFIVGLICGMLDSRRSRKVPEILYFTRRWTHQEASKALIQQATNSTLRGDTTAYKDALVTAIGQIKQSGFVFDNTARTIGEIRQRVSCEVHLPKLVIVDGLEHFGPEVSENNPQPALPAMLNQLKALAKETWLPIIVSAPPLKIESEFGDLEVGVEV